MVKAMEMRFVSRENVSLLVDLYELTMADAYFREGKNGIATFDLFARSLPKNRGFLVACGIYDALSYIGGLKFGKEEIAYLGESGKFSSGFLGYLENFRFSGEVSAVPEGTCVFEKEPLIRISAPLVQAQILESFLLNCVSFQTMIATKAARVCMAAKGKPVCDFGLRRAQGMDAGLKSSRASYIGGCAGTSNILAGKEYKIPVTGTVAHSFILAYESEMEAFRAIARTYGNGCVFLIDTYDTLRGAGNAVKAAHEMDREGKKLGAVRIDSGNLAKLSRKVRGIFDAEGLEYVKIIASGGLDEYKVEKLADALAPIDSFGVGTAMDVSADAPCLDMNYKLCEYEGKGRRKMSAGKATLPGKKQLFRLGENGLCVRDVIALEGEKIEGSALLVKMMGEGRMIWKIPGIGEIRKKCREEIGKLPSGVRKIKNPSKYPVELSEGLLAQV